MRGWIVKFLKTGFIKNLLQSMKIFNKQKFTVEGGVVY